MPSIWLEDPYASRPSLVAEDRCDIVVVGGGLVGVSATYFLARAGCDVVLLERRSIGEGATGRGNGFLCGGVHHAYAKAREIHGEGKARALWDLSRRNHDLIRSMVEREGIECGYSKHGSYRLARTEDERRLLERSGGLLRDNGFSVEERIPTGWEARWRGGLFFPEDGALHPVRWVRGLAKAAEQAGARIFEGTKVTGVEEEGVRTSEGRVRCEMALFACGGFSPLLHSFFEETVAPVRGQVLATAPLDRVLLPAPVVFSWGLDFLGQRSDGRVFLGGGRYVAPQKEYTYSERPTQEIQVHLDGLLQEVLPEAKDARITHRWAGVMDFACDELPCVGPIPGTVRHYAAAGFHGSGMNLGVVAAEMVAEMMLEGKTDYPAELFSPRRHR